MFRVKYVLRKQQACLQTYLIHFVRRLLDIASALIMNVIQSDSKLLLGFSWPIIFKPETIEWNCLQNMKV
jgi:hypothetical protein